MRRRDFLKATAAGGVALAVGAAQEQAAVPTPKPRIGINLANLNDWGGDLPTRNAFLQSRSWTSQAPGAPYNQGPPLALDRNGWIRRLRPPGYAETVPLSASGHIPPGEYTILYRGTGQLEVAASPHVAVADARLGAITARLDGQGAMFIRVRATDPTDPIRDIRVLFPGESAAAAATNPWRADFLARWRGMNSLRFMNWQRISGSTHVTWEDRPTPAAATWATGGAPLEWMVDLANRLVADPWFCIPHLADDRYVTEFARTVRARLDPARKVYVEYSNELWNGQFKQSKWVQSQGKALGLGPTPWQSAWRYAARRSVQVFAIFAEVFEGTDRLVRVLPSQAGATVVSETICAFEDAAHHADALAIAPYIGPGLRPAKSTRAGQPSAEAVAGWSPDQILDYVEQTTLPVAIKSMQAQAAVAAKYGLALVAYEGGPSILGVGGGQNTPGLTEALRAANVHPRMGTILDAYFTAWEQCGGGLFNYYNSTMPGSKFGHWGALAFADDDPAAAPKYQALCRWRDRWNATA